MDRQRIDKWLWHARVVRTRSAAVVLIEAGHVRVNGERTRTPSRVVRAGDVLTIALDRLVRVLKVEGFAERRGSPGAARGLFVDLSSGEEGRGDARIAANTSADDADDAE